MQKSTAGADICLLPLDDLSSAPLVSHTDEFEAIKSPTSGVSKWHTAGMLFGFALTTTVSTFLLYSSHQKRSFTGHTYSFVISSRATVQLLVQNSSAVNLNPNITRTSLGTFSFDPVRNLVGSILQEASLAISPNYSVQTHRKLDNTGFSFRGRSFGVGASVGLATVGPKVLSMQFFEDGYLSNITCQYNRTLSYHVSLRTHVESSRVSLYDICGNIAGGSVECVVVPGHGDSQIVMMLGHGDMPATNIDPSSVDSSSGYGRLTDNLVEEMGLIAQVSTSVLLSPFGIALMSNVVNAQFARLNGYLPKALNEEQVNLLGIESALESMIDNIIIALSSAQFVIAANKSGGIQKVPMNATIAAIKFGDPGYIYYISVVNIFILILYLVEAFRNRGWRKLSNFDYRDLKSVVVGSSLGGRDIANDVLSNKKEGSEIWQAEPVDKVTGSTLLELGGVNGVSIVLGEKKR
ncbi:hypothetical protein VTL71DRAFT_3361 [Oculimacula yallundae]|uniref:Uncharacterized protein n=1 Tax=Oculimacula yallundae TaxID=86028 RepID=A0ABR4C834_9HELO